MAIETILGLAVGVVAVWLFVYSAALIGARHALRGYEAGPRRPETEPLTGDDAFTPTQ